MSSNLNNFLDFNNNQDLPVGQWIYSVSNKKRDQIIQLIVSIKISS